jgi:hypothetical protein
MANGVFYAQAIIKGVFHDVTDEPKEDSVFRLINLDDDYYQISIYHGAAPRIVADPDFINEIPKQIINPNGHAGSDILVKYGVAELGADGNFNVVNPPEIALAAPDQEVENVSGYNQHLDAEGNILHEDIKIAPPEKHPFQEYLEKSEQEARQQEEADQPEEETAEQEEPLREEESSQEEELAKGSLTKEGLRRVMDDNDKEAAERILDDYARGNIDIEIEALTDFVDFMNKFAMKDKNLTPIGAAAAQRLKDKLEELDRENQNPSEQAAEKIAEEVDKFRMHSLNSDENQILFDRLTLGIYQDMGLVSGFDASNTSPSEAAEAIENVGKLSDDQREEYAERLVDALMKDQQMFWLAPPSVLADAYNATKKRAAEGKGDGKVLSARLSALAERIDDLIDNFASRTGYWYADPSNIADAYAGYGKMFDARRADLEPDAGDAGDVARLKADVLNKLEENSRKLEELITEYDGIHSLGDLNESDAKELSKRWSKISADLKDVEISDEVLKLARKYEFLDKEGNPIPQFLDGRKKASAEFRKGFALDANGRLARIISLAKNDVAMNNVGKLGGRISAEDLKKQTNERILWKLFEINAADEIFRGVVQELDEFADKRRFDEFLDRLEKQGGQISDGGYQAALDAQVNQNAGFAGRLAQKVGGDKDIVFKPFEAVADIDKLAKTRSEKEGAGGRKQKVGFFKRMAKNFGMAFAVSAGLTFIGKATGVAYAGAAIGTVLGVGNFAWQGYKWSREQKKKDKAGGLKNFIKDKRNWGPAAATAMGVAATISMATGNPGLAAGLGIGAMAVGGGSGAVMTYKDARASGYGKGKSWLGALGVAGATVLGGLAGRAAMSGIAGYVNENTDSNLFKHEEAGTKTETQRTEQTETKLAYNDGVVQSNERILNMWYRDNPDLLGARLESLTEQGFSRDDAVRYLLIAHDAGAKTADNMLLHVQGGADIRSGGTHYVGQGAFHQAGVDNDGILALRGSVSGADVNVSDASRAAFEAMNPYVSGTNEVGYVPGAPMHTDGVLPRNAMFGANGRLVPGSQVYSTYVDGGEVFHSETTTNIIETQTEVPTTAWVANPDLAFPAGLGTFGIYFPRTAKEVEQLKERIGALLDKIQERRKSKKTEEETEERDNREEEIKEEAEEIENKEENIEEETEEISEKEEPEKTEEFETPADLEPLKQDKKQDKRPLEIPRYAESVLRKDIAESERKLRALDYTLKDKELNPSVAAEMRKAKDSVQEKLDKLKERLLRGTRDDVRE